MENGKNGMDYKLLLCCFCSLLVQFLSIEAFQVTVHIVGTRNICRRENILNYGLFATASVSFSRLK